MFECGQVVPGSPWAHSLDTEWRVIQLASCISMCNPANYVSKKVRHVRMHAHRNFLCKRFLRARHSEIVTIGEAAWDPPSSRRAC